MVERFRAALERCPRTVDENGGEAVWESHGPAGLGDESLTAVAFAEQDGMRFTPATHHTVVRVGNAVLVAVYDGEFGAARPAELSKVLAEQEDHARRIAARMCVFGATGCGTDSPDGEDDTSGSGGSDGSGGSGWSVPLTDADLLAVEDLPALERTTKWRVVEPQPVPTKACQADWLTALGYEQMVFAEFRTSGDGRPAETNTAVLRFGDEATAQGAFETVLGWVRTCDERVDDTRQVFTVADEGVTAPTEGADARWRAVELAAPEICTECDAVWFSHQGAALLGDRVVLVAQNVVGGPLEPDGLADAMERTMTAAVRAARP